MRLAYVLALGLCAGTAQAATVTRTIELVAGDFAPSAGNAAPQDPITGRLTLVADLTGDAAGALASLDLVIGGVRSTGADYAYARSGDLLLAGTGCTPSGCSIGSLANGFYVVLSGLKDKLGAQLLEVAYSSATLDGVWTAGTTSVTVTPVPAGLVLLGSALAGLGVASARRRR